MAPSDFAALMRLFRLALVELFWPRNANCLGCGDMSGVDGNWLCGDCRAALVPIERKYKKWCPRCGLPLLDKPCDRCARWPEDGVAVARYAYVYAPPASALVRHMKYDGAHNVAGFMADEMVGMLLTQGMTGYDYILCVPMHKTRLLARGYNPSRILAMQVAKKLDIAYLDALARVVHTKQQAKQKGEARVRPMSHAFRATADVRGKRVLLVDDVLTTGTTVNGCARVLYDAGAARVDAAAFCGSGGKKPGVREKLE